MSRGFPRIGSKPKLANPGNYVKNYTRSIKERGRRYRRDRSKPRVELLPSTKPVPTELTKPDTPVIGFGALGVIFLISLAAFIALVVLN